MFQVRPGRLVVALVVLFAILGAGSVAAVAQGNSPQTQAVFGTFTASPVNVMQRTCSGQDGLYLELRGKSAGAITSSDPRGRGNGWLLMRPLTSFRKSSSNCHLMASSP